MTNFSPSANIEAIKKKALIATIVGFLCGGILGGILGLLGYLKADTEPETAQKFTKWSFIVTGIVIALYVIGAIAYVAIIGAAISQSGM